jgi:NADH-quinone oxidoreductase subunit N
MLSSEIQSVSILPELVLSIVGIIVMLVDPFMAANKSRRPLGIVAFVGTLIALAASFYQIGFQGTSYFNVIRVVP